MSHNVIGPALTYIYRIRNDAKRGYAMDYLRFLQGETEPKRPATLSIMAAQAVEMNVRALIK